MQVDSKILLTNKGPVMVTTVIIFKMTFFEVNIL